MAGLRMEVSAHGGWSATRLVRPRARAEPAYSVLRDRPMRPLHVALARRLASIRGDDPCIDAMRRLYDALPISGQAECLAEFALLRGQDRILEFPSGFSGSQADGASRNEPR